MTTPGSVYEAIGGMPTFRKIVSGFYAQVPDDDILGPMYPEDDMAGAEERLAWFLSQYWGGPPLFNENRGAPRMRLRHAKFPIDMAAHDRWLELMKNSLDQIDEETLPQAYRQMIWQHMNQLAGMLINKAP
ncbi:MAG: globin [Corynebacterium sp.]|jgi:hemoglobin|uniref:Hemin receptor n=1 Tax=Corynebacterium stationis TaxID=1705 RepID=A0A0X8VIH0_9CORY|nr:MULTISPECIES: globin [Corynebacterium]AMJ45238.1 hemin receptor [Corynebacterium stationis]APT95669.1 hemin receptor [Corynebacterium stationis]AQX71693.1 globin [Corynebacterium stationis]ASJ19373.1 hemin receptor [Corynebacterium stationis]MDN6137894.1 globin [Corynebacterium sp.]